MNEQENYMKIFDEIYFQLIDQFIIVNYKNLMTKCVRLQLIVYYQNWK